MAIYDKYGNEIGSAFDHGGALLGQAHKADGTPVPLVSFDTSAALVSLPPIKLSGTLQGGCTDGTYIYQIIYTTTDVAGILVKYNIATGAYTTKAFTDSIPFGHGNDMAYSPNTARIYVATMSADGAVVELDTDLNYIATRYLANPNGSAYAVWGICYDRIRGRLLSLCRNGVAVYDDSLACVGWFKMPSAPVATMQGFETDGVYLYRVTYKPSTIDVSTIRGDHVATVDLPLSGEPESLMYNWDNGAYYVNYNYTEQLFYSMTFK